MKKLLFITALITLSFTTAQSQVDSIQSLTMETVYNDFKSAMVGIGEALSVGAEHVYGVLVTQQQIKSIAYLSILIIVSITLIPLWRFVVKLHDKGKEVSEVFGVIAVIFSGILIIFLMLTFNTIVTGLFNPEYGAIMEILSKI